MSKGRQIWSRLRPLLKYWRVWRISLRNQSKHLGEKLLQVFAVIEFSE